MNEIRWLLNEIKLLNQYVNPTVKWDDKRGKWKVILGHSARRKWFRNKEQVIIYLKGWLRDLRLQKGVVMLYE